MRVFEAKPGCTVALDHGFQRGRAFEVSATTVKVNVYHVKDDTEIVEVADSGFVWDAADAMLFDGTATHNPTTSRYEYTLTLGAWNCGIYLVEWDATINGSQIFEYDKLYVVRATQAEVIESLNMPSSINAAGITIDYAERLRNLTSQRGVRVGRISKRRGTSNVDDAERDYNR